MKTIAGAASFASLKRSRTREAPMPTIASTNSDADIEKNGAFASPATARASSVLPVPGGPERSTPCGIRAPSVTYFSGWRRKSTTSVSSAFASSIPATSSKVIGMVAALVATCARAAERAEHPLDVPGAAHQQNEQPDEQDRRPEADEQVLPPGDAAGERLRVHDDLLLLEQVRQRLRVGERGDLGLEVGRGLGALVARRLLEHALDRRALRGDRDDAARLHLVEEERAVRDADPRGRMHGARRDPEVEDEQHGEERSHAPAEAKPRLGLLLRRRRG